MRADSFITSPSWPVSTRPSLPFIEVASMKRTSPPAPVTDRPVATPDGRALGRLLEEALAPEGVAQLLDTELDRRGCLAGRDPRRRLAQERPELALEVPHARLAGVLGHDGAQHVVRDLHLVLAQAVAIALARPQVAACDRDLLVGRVPVEAHDLHTVEQRGRDRLRHVGGGDED